MKSRREPPIWASAAAAGAAALSLALVTGCAATKYESQQQDSANPVDVDAKNPNWVGCLGKPTLAPGESCWLVVQAGLFSNFSGISVQSQHRYRVHVPPGQYLFDSTRRVPMPEGDGGSNFTRHFGFLKRSPDQPWFALMVTVGAASDTDAVRIAGTTELPGKCGELSFWVNDWRRKYGNNKGRLWIRLERLPDAAPGTCVASP